MPRHAQPFQIVKRKDPGYKTTIFYARFRVDGELLPWTSTGETSRSAARAWAQKQIKDKTVGTNRRLTFAKYAERWWLPDHEYIRGKIARGKHITRSYCDNQRHNLEYYILPAFGKKAMAKITAGMVESWVMSLGEKHKIGPVTVNHVLRCLKVMMSEACRLGTIPADPAAKIAPLAEDQKERTVLTIAEIGKLFDEDTISTVWKDDERAYTGNLLGISCGLRLGEVQGLTVGNVQPGYLLVSHSWERKYGLKATKTGVVRQVPMPQRAERHLSAVIDASPYRQDSDFVFYGSDRHHAVDHKLFARSLIDALEAIGIKEKERTARGLTFHSHRHTFNSIMRGRVPDHVLQAMTGHKTERMVDLYSHVGSDELAGVLKVQSEAFG